MRPLTVIALMLAGCGGSAPADVHGPYTGAPYLFYVAHLAVSMQSATFSPPDLDGDGRGDDSLAVLVGSVEGEGDTQMHADDVLAAAPPLLVELFTDDPSLRNDPTVGVRIADSGQIGASLRDGVLRSNRVAPTHGETTTLPVAAFPQADASALILDHFELDLAGDGNGGFVGNLAGTLPAAVVLDTFAPAFLQMMASTPTESLIHFLDTNDDGRITREELATNLFVQPLIYPDVAITPGVRDHWSANVQLTLVPCASIDSCPRPATTASCFDRVRNGDETDVDCGGSCGACAGGQSCKAAGDCVTGACDAGLCRAPSCADGIRDGFEVDVDCGHGCAPCQNGAHCEYPEECVSGSCNGTTCVPR